MYMYVCTVRYAITITNPKLIRGYLGRHVLARLSVDLIKLNDVCGNWSGTLIRVPHPTISVLTIDLSIY